MAHFTKNSSILLLGVLIAIAFCGEAQAWAPEQNLAQLKPWLSNGNLNVYLNQWPLIFTVLAAYYENASGGFNYKIWIIVQISKKKQKICHIIGFKTNKYPYIYVKKIICYTCNKLKKHYHYHKKHSSSHSHHSHHSKSHSSHSSSDSSSSDKKN